MAFLKMFSKKSKKRTAKRKVRKPKKRVKKRKTVRPKKVRKRKVVRKPKVRRKVKIIRKSVKKIKPVKIEAIEKLDDEKAYDILKRFRITLPPYRFCKNEDQLTDALKRIGFPCVMKVSGDIVHKTNVNGVRLNIKNIDEAKKTFHELIKIKGCKKVLVQKMITEGYELIVGGKRDPQFGRIIAFGAGGIFTELLKDVSFRISPLNRIDAQEMVKEVKFSDVITRGFRNQKPADINSIVNVILSVSRIIEKNPKIKELDINPLFATSTKAIATDVRIILE